jgi:hypothetical protein
LLDEKKISLIKRFFEFHLNFLFGNTNTISGISEKNIDEYKEEFFISLEELKNL